MTKSFITQSNHQFACSSSWKDGLGCSRFSLTHVLCLPFCVTIVVWGLGSVPAAAVSHARAQGLKCAVLGVHGFGFSMFKLCPIRKTSRAVMWIKDFIYDNKVKHP